MDRITVEQLAEWTGGTTLPTGVGGGVGPDVVIDSRQISPGAVFVALPGERVDGHTFVAAALDAGAGAAVVTRPVETSGTQIVVSDAVQALTDLGRRVVTSAQQRGLQVVAVTGSSGKTSTKDLIAQVLATSGTTVAPEGSFNNEIGVPLTGCKVDASTRFLVSEMGARGIGHIAWLTRITPPNIGVVLNVGHAHVGEFGSQDAIAQAKGELVEAVPTDGWAVLNADDERVAAMAARTSARVAFFSAKGRPADGALRVWAADVAPDALQRYTFTLMAATAGAGLAFDGEVSAAVTLRVLGEHSVANALAAASAGLCARLPIQTVADALSGATSLSRWRMELEQRPDGLAVLNDAYNANPDSMAAAVRAVARMRRPGGRVIAVIGDMLELGDAASREHRRVGELAAEAGVDDLIAVGVHGSAVVEGFAASGGWARYFPGKDTVLAALDGRIGPHDIVLVKASRGIGLETVAQELLTEGAG